MCVVRQAPTLTLVCLTVARPSVLAGGHWPYSAIEILSTYLLMCVYIVLYTKIVKGQVTGIMIPHTMGIYYKNEGKVRRKHLFHHSTILITI